MIYRIDKRSIFAIVSLLVLIVAAPSLYMKFTKYWYSRRDVSSLDSHLERQHTGGATDQGGASSLVDTILHPVKKGSSFLMPDSLKQSEGDIDVETEISRLLTFQVKKKCSEREEVKILMLGIGTGLGLYTLADEIFKSGISFPLNEPGVSSLKGDGFKNSDACHITLHGADSNEEFLRVAQRRIETFPERITLALFHMKQREEDNQIFIAKYRSDGTGSNQSAEPGIPMDQYVSIDDFEHNYEIVQSLERVQHLSKEKLQRYKKLLQPEGVLVVCVQKPSIMEAVNSAKPVIRHVEEYVMGLYAKIGLEDRLHLTGTEDVDCFYGVKSQEEDES